MLVVTETICARIYAIAEDDGSCEDALRYLVSHAVAGHGPEILDARRRCADRGGDNPTWARAERLLTAAIAALPRHRDVRC